MNKIVILLALAVLLVFSGCTSGEATGLVSAPENNTQTTASPTPGTQENEEQENSSISIPLDKISTTAKWFELESSGATIRFFAVKADDGSVRTAFDACDVCYSSHKGYSQQGNEMVCNNCGNRYPIDGLGTKNKAGGGCWPGFLPSRVEGNLLIIDKADIAAGRYRFA